MTIMRVRFIGCGDAFGSGGRFNTCFLVEPAAGRFLIDCGASSLVALRRCGIDPDTIGTILITHLHRDHFGGLVFLLRQATLIRQRTLALTIAGPPGLAARLDAAIEVFFPGGAVAPTSFALRVVELAPRVATALDGLTVTAFPVSHASGAPPYALRAETEGKAIAYTGDTLWVDDVAEAARGADLFICEAYTYDRRRGHHLALATVRAQLPAIGAKRTILTHLGPEILHRLPELTPQFALPPSEMTVEI